jgi:CBS domain-containing protein
MIICPYCDSENIVGADSCEHCGQPLNELDLPTPATEVERSLLRDRLATIPPNEPVVTVSPTDSLRDVLKLMASRSIGCVLVTEDNKLIGIFSERDVVTRVGPNVEQLYEKPVRDFITTGPQTLDPEAKVAFALHRMAVGHYRHVPIVDQKSRPIGIVSVRDLLGFLTQKLAAE